MDLEERFAGGVALTPYQDLVEKCLYYLAREDERQKIAAKGFEIFSRTKQSEYLGNALNLKYEPTDQEISQDGSEDGSGDGSRILSQETRKEINKGISEEVFTEISHESRQRSLYLDLMQKCLTNTIYQDRPQDIWSGQAYSKKKRARGLDWPSMAHTMIGSLRMANLREIVEKVLEDDIAGDFIETGTWRGGACIFMRAILKDYGVTDRKIWCADSFQGLPVPESNKYPEDAGDTHFTYDQLRVSLQEVQDNFRKYDLLDGQVEFLKGWFKDTLPIAPIKSLAVLRLDGDLYQSTMEGFQHLYHKLSKGGFVIIDDYGAVPACKKAVHDFRKEKSITDPINDIDGVGVWWRKIG
ncbi:MAG: hypothetical protein GY702_16135 [Desulfobulbaceae bacterium]|nr:hypothetical protein [Desulfobulbaceae bacterium]